MPGNPPVDVQEFGQSIWYDHIRRGLITSGELQRLIDEYGVLGVTSNPSIFQKAIGESDDYDEAIQHMLDLEAHEIYERLAIEDVQRALDILRPIYDRTNRRDGYVSLEVSPLLAQDTAKTIAEARRLFAAINRPNAMIKIPATPAGIPAIEESIAAGINVNVTLIFSVKNYVQVAEAYIRGLERRHAAGEDITHVASVASFFLSRIDTLVDRMLESNIRAAQGRDVSRVGANSKLLGKAAIASARLAYRRFMLLFHGERFARLRAAGAQVQRPLWASTGVKNPAYPDTLYVDNLIGRDTVNTLPPDTLKAFQDHGVVSETLTLDSHDAGQVMDMLAEVGIDIEQVSKRLQDDGVEAFAEAFGNLLTQVEAKRTILKTGVMAQQKVALGIYADAVQTAIKTLDSRLVNARIWSQDATVWKEFAPAIAHIKQHMAWLNVRETIDIPRLKAFQQNIREAGFERAVVMGMGGASLTAETLSRTFGKQAGFPAVLALDNTDPAHIRALTDALDPRKTLFVVASRSGGTVETQAFFKYFYELTGGNGAQFVAITTAGTELDQLAQARGFRDVFHNPLDMLGAYSALSYFGMAPAALMGLDLDALWSQADRMMRACGEIIAGNRHPGIWLGAVIGALALQGRDKVSIHCSRSIASFAAWAEMILAETLGKEGKGVTPIAGATVGKPHDYATDRLFIYLKVEGDDDVEAMDSGIRMLREAGHPRVTLTLKDRYELAGEFFRWEYAAVIAARLLGVDPFDVSGVEESKRNVARLLGRYKQLGALPASTPVMTENSVSLYADEVTLAPLRELCSEHGYDSSSLAELLAAQFIGTMAGDYFALLAYLPPTAEIDAALQEARRRLRHVTKRAVTVGYGPRYLHTTGQLHKGGPNNGIFIQLTADCAEDVAIPGEPFTFGVLHAAQAAGDLESLQAHKRRAMRLHISGDAAAGIGVLLEAIDRAEARRQ